MAENITIPQHAITGAEILANALYSKPEAGAITKTSESTIHRAIKKGKLKGAYLNKRIVIRGAELLRWIQACEQ